MFWPSHELYEKDPWINEYKVHTIKVHVNCLHLLLHMYVNKTYKNKNVANTCSGLTEYIFFKHVCMCLYLSLLWENVLSAYTWNCTERRPSRHVEREKNSSKNARMHVYRFSPHLLYLRSENSSIVSFHNNIHWCKITWQRFVW